MPKPAQLGSVFNPLPGRQHAARLLRDGVGDLNPEPDWVWGDVRVAAVLDETDNASPSDSPRSIRMETLSRDTRGLWDRCSAAGRAAGAVRCGDRHLSANLW
jgi:hypothetical protein